MEENPYKAPTGTPEKRRSTVGTASFLLACSMTVLLLVILGLSDLIDAHRDLKWLEALGMTIVVLFLVGNLLAVVLGIISLLQKGRKKILGAIGLSLACTLVGCLVIVAICSEPRPLRGPVEVHLRH